MKVSAQFEVEISYGQLAIFDSALEEPFNDWTDRHVAQGFAWRRGSVSFRTVEEGTHIVHVGVVDKFKTLDESTVRAVDVPFTVPVTGDLEVGSIGGTTPLSLPPGTYMLRCEFIAGGSGAPHARLSFAKSDKPKFHVVRADDALSPERALLRSASPGRS